MQGMGSTSTKWGPDDPVDGLHPVLHITLRTGHEQESLGVGRYLFLLPGICKTGRHRLTTGTLVQTQGAFPHSTLSSPQTS